MSRPVPEGRPMRGEGYRSQPDALDQPESQRPHRERGNSSRTGFPEGAVPPSGTDPAGPQEQDTGPVEHRIVSPERTLGTPPEALDSGKSHGDGHGEIFIVPDPAVVDPRQLRTVRFVPELPRLCASSDMVHTYTEDQTRRTGEVHVLDAKAPTRGGCVVTRSNIRQCHHHEPRE